MTIDILEGIILVLQSPMRPRLGLGIGSCLAAGGAALTAAWTEEFALRNVPKRIRFEIETFCYIKRWLDDVLYVISRGLSQDANELLRIMRSKFFYGAALPLEQVREPEPFGFLISIDPDRGIQLRGRLPFIEERKKDRGPGWQPSQSTLHGGPQFRSDQTEQAVTKGHITRYLDLTTEPVDKLLVGVTRLLFEMISVGFPKDRVTRALKKIAFADTPQLKSILKVLEWPAKRQHAFMTFYDQLDTSVRLSTVSSMLEGESLQNLD